MLFQVSLPPTLLISPCISVLWRSHCFFWPGEISEGFLPTVRDKCRERKKESTASQTVQKHVFCAIKWRKPQFLNSRSLMLWVSQMSLFGAQPFHTPTNNFTFSTLKTRFNKPFSFHRQTLWTRRMDSQFRFYSLFICKEDLISSLLSTHKVRVTMGTQSAPLFSMALRPVPLWWETAVFTFGRQTGSLRAAMFVFEPDT